MKIALSQSRYHWSRAHHGFPNSGDILTRNAPKKKKPAKAHGGASRLTISHLQSRKVIVQGMAHQHGVRRQQLPEFMLHLLQSGFDGTQHCCSDAREPVREFKWNIESYPTKNAEKCAFTVEYENNRCAQVLSPLSELQSSCMEADVGFI